MPRKRRTLTAEEQRLWSKVVAQVRAVEAEPPAPVATPPKKPRKTAQPPALPELKPFRIGSKAKPGASAEAAPSFVDAPAKTSPNMDRRNFQRLVKGKLDIDATLDLHGLTAEQAQQRLTIFVRNAHAAGLRLLLIITGKGQRADLDEFNRPRRGVLKSGVPEWLKAGPLSGLVLQVTQAHPKHGGGGAYYVYLRRTRE